MRRKLTAGERKLLAHVYGSSMPLDNVEVRRRLSRRSTGAFAPFGTINLPRLKWEADYAGPNLRMPMAHRTWAGGARGAALLPTPARYDRAHLFLHEAAHTWQHFNGIRLVARWLGEKIANAPEVTAHKRAHGGTRVDASFEVHYGYTLQGDKDLLDYLVEQQAEILADYFAHKLWRRALPNAHTPTDYEGKPGDWDGALTNFLASRTYPQSGRPLRRARARVRAWQR